MQTEERRAPFDQYIQPLLWVTSSLGGRSRCVCKLSVTTVVGRATRVTARSCCMPSQSRILSQTILRNGCRPDTAPRSASVSETVATRRPGALAPVTRTNIAWPQPIYHHYIWAGYARYGGHDPPVTPQKGERLRQMCSVANAHLPSCGNLRVPAGSLCSVELKLPVDGCIEVINMCGCTLPCAQCRQPANAYEH